VRGREGDRGFSGRLAADKDGRVLIYEFGGPEGKRELRPRDGDGAPGSRASIRKEAFFLLTLDGLEEVEALKLRVDGQLDVLHWPNRTNLSLARRSASAAATPVTGARPSGVETLDVPMLEALNSIKCSGAALTVARGNHVYYSRGYGWSDFERNVRITPETPMAIASCNKPITAAMVRQLFKEHNLPLTTKVLPFFGVKPAGAVIDNRVWEITFKNVIAHEAGWQGEPFDRAFQAYNGRTRPGDSVVCLNFIAVQRLSARPGTKYEYDNYGYDVMTHVVPKLSGQTYADYLRSQLCRPYGMKELQGVRGHKPRPGDPPPLWNGLVLADLPFQHAAVSMPALCTFMSHFWIDGTPRDKSRRSDVHAGSLESSTTLCVWRPDGINIAYSFNGRAVNVDPGKAVNDAVDQLVAQGKIPAH
jgi:CubicO group peptidase (beta-lactamase class C family)